MPVGELVTVPVPSPCFVTVNSRFSSVNSAPTSTAPSTVNEQVLNPLQTLLQPPKSLPVPGVALSVTSVPYSNESLQVPPAAVQAMSPTSLVTVPLPSTVTSTGKIWRVKVAVTA